MFHEFLLKMRISLKEVNRDMQNKVRLCFPLRKIKEETLKLFESCKASVCSLKVDWAQQENTRQRES